jgi:hypothetical protein
MEVKWDASTHLSEGQEIQLKILSDEQCGRVEMTNLHHLNY